MLKNNPELNFHTLAPNAGSDIIKGKSDQGAAGNAAGNAGGKDGAAGKGSNPYSHLGIEDADYQAYLKGKLTEDDLLGIANAASYYKAASGSGAGTNLYQNEAHKRAANIRAKYDSNYITNDTYDYTHGGLYDPNRVMPVPGPPKYEVLTSLTVDARAGTGQGDGYSTFASSRPPKQNKNKEPAQDFGINDKEMSDLYGMGLSVVNMAELYDKDADGKEQVENIMKDLATIFTLGDGQMREVALDMFQHFIDGDGADYSNPVLMERVIEHPSTQSFVVNTMEEIRDFLSRHKGNLSVLKLDKDFENDMLKISTPKYNNKLDLLGGLTISLNDTWGYYVDIADYQSDGKHYSGTIRYTLYDHFGLDENDISKSNWYKGAFEPFAAWYVLQHYEGCEGKYKPFVTNVAFEVPFSGEIDE